ncbi:MAG: hypothetical protein JO110_18160 [Acetobacteraceae bacterium]|nr:hypothetical protein [Acetobacteraceae bacterium]
MKTVLKCAAIAGALMFAAGSAAWAQSYTTNPGTQGSYSSNPGSYSSNPGTSGSYSGNAGTQGFSNPGTYGANQQGWNSNQQGWNSGMQGQGTSTPYGSQSYSQAGYGMGNNITTFQQAEQELGKYGYNNVHDLRAMQGWSADAMRNGQRVHVIIGDNGLIATFPGQ